MPRVKITSEHDRQTEKIHDVIMKTDILKREFELEYGKWNFTVIGPFEKGGFILREGFASHMMIHTSPVYSASVGSPDILGAKGLPIEEFIEDSVPHELKGLNIYSIDPLRPLTITQKIKIKGVREMEKAVTEYMKGRDAVIMTPDEQYWFISVLKYLNECDESFPDEFIQKIHNRELPLKAQFLNSLSFEQGGGNTFH